MVLVLTLAVLGVMLVVMVIAWAFGLSARNGGWTDVFWSAGSGVTLAAAALGPWHGAPPSARLGVVAGMVALWAVRLFAYLAPRVASHPEDPRYAKFREDFGAAYPIRMLWVTLPQAPATAFLALSVLVAARRPGELDLRDLLGVGLFFVAIAGEYVSDEQMKRFRANPANKGQVIETGFWAWSRHPNYFFQWLGWLAYPVIALEPTLPATWLSLSAAVVMYGLLRYVSGVPPLEEAMLKSRGEKYRKYQERVSVFFPLPPRRAAVP
jgi:steroid 5-alpha reductase family enzyme